MILTGKTKEDFLKQFCGVVPVNEIELYAHIIDWFDNVGIYIGVDSWVTCGEIKETFFWYNVKDINQESLIKETYETSLITSRNKTRLEATKIAISKANYFRNQSCSQAE